MDALEIAHILLFYGKDMSECAVGKRQTMIDSLMWQCYISFSSERIFLYLLHQYE